MGSTLEGFEFARRPGSSGFARPGGTRRSRYLDASLTNLDANALTASGNDSTPPKN
jgi:hypothetical protein